MTTLVYIHGHRATKTSFSYIHSQLKDKIHNHIFISYDSDNGFYNNLLLMKETLADVNDIFFVTHSLGGIYALHLTDYFGDKVQGCVSLSAPFGGSDAAITLGMLFPDQVYRDIGPYSPPILRASGMKLNVLWKAIVSISGHSNMMRQQNDSVLTTESMTSRKDVEYMKVNYNHFEILMSSSVIDTISDTIDRCYGWSLHE
jgi:pimeloyl-ACP methyl ester carboxylesterase